MQDQIQKDQTDKTINHFFQAFPKEENGSQSNKHRKSPTEFVFLFCPLLVRTHGHHRPFPPQRFVFIANPKKF